MCERRPRTVCRVTSDTKSQRIVRSSSILQSGIACHINVPVACSVNLPGRNTAVTNAGSPTPSLRAARVTRKSVRWTRTTQ